MTVINLLFLVNFSEILLSYHELHHTDMPEILDGYQSFINNIILHLVILDSYQYFFFI